MRACVCLHELCDVPVVPTGAVIDIAIGIDIDGDPDQIVATLDVSDSGATVTPSASVDREDTGQ